VNIIFLKKRTVLYNNIINFRKTKQKSLPLLSIILNNIRFDCRIITIKITLQTFSIMCKPKSTKKW